MGILFFRGEASEREVIMSEKINLIEIMNGKKIYSRFSDKLVTFVDEITDSMSEDGVYSDGMSMIDNIEGVEDDISGMYCIMKDGTQYNMEDFYEEFGAFEGDSDFPNNIVNLIADRDSDKDKGDVLKDKIDKTFRGETFCVGKHFESIEIDVKYKGYDLQIIVEYEMEKGKIARFGVWTGAANYCTRFYDFGIDNRFNEEKIETIDEMISLIYGNFVHDNIDFDEIIETLEDEC